MKKEGEYEISKEVKDALDAFIKKGIELYKDYNVDQRNSLIKTAIDEILNDFIEDMKKGEDEEYSEKEIRGISKELRKFVNEYYQQKIKEK